MANMNVGNLSVDVSADITSLDRELKKAVSVMKGFKSKITKESQTVGTRIGSSMSKSMSQSMKNMGDTKRVFNNISRDAESAGLRAGERFGVGTISALQRQAPKIKQEANNIFKSMEKSFKSISDIGRKGTRQISIPLITMGGKIATDKGNMDKDMAMIDTILDGKHRSVDQIRSEIKEISNMSGIAMSEVAKATYDGLSLGIDERNLKGFTGLSAMLAQVGDAPLSVVQSGISRVANVFDDELTGGYERISDLIFKTQELGNMPIEKTAHLIGRVSLPAASAGATPDELFASLAALSKVKTPEDTVTSLTRAFQGLVAPTEKAKKVAKALGVELSTDYLKQGGLLNYVEELQKKTGGDQEILASLFGEKGGSAFGYLMDDIGKDSFIRGMEEMANSTGTTKEAMEKMMTPMKAFQDSMNRLKNSFTEAGGMLDPILENLGGKIDRLANIINRLTPGQAETIASIASAFIVFFPAIRVVGLMGTSIMQTTKLIGHMKGSLVRLVELSAGAGKGLGSFIGGLSTTSVMAMGATVAVGGFLYMLHKTEDKSITAAQTIGDNFGALGMRIQGLLQMIGGMTLSIVTITVGSISMLMETALNKIEGFVRDIGNTASNIPGLKTIGGGLLNAADGLNARKEKHKSRRVYLADLTSRTIDGAGYKMNTPMDALNTSRYKRGKLPGIEERSGLTRDEILINGRLSDEALNFLEKDVKKGLGKGMDGSGAFDMSGFSTNFTKDVDKSMKDISAKFKGTDMNNEGLKSIRDIFDSIGEKSAKAKDPVDELKKKVEELSESFKGTSDSIKGSFGMFDRFRSKTISGHRLMDSARRRSQGMLERESLLQSLSNKGLSAETMAKLHETSADELGALRGLDSRLSREELMEWERLQVGADRSAERQAVENTIILNIHGIDNDSQAKKFGNAIYSELHRKGIRV